MRDWLRAAFGCDVRSLAALRMALGLLLLADLAWRLPHFDVWYGAAGAWPISAAQAERPLRWSLYFLSDNPVWTTALMAISAVSAVALFVGWRTRVATVVSWLLLASLQTRNDLPLNAGDIVLRMLLLLGCFLPLGACWSLDARKQGARVGAYASVGSAVLLIQVALIYVFNALFKTGASWVNGTAILQTLQQETYRTSLAETLLPLPGLLNAGTHAIWWFELVGPLLVFIPWRRGILRLWVALGFIGFHVGLLLTIRIGMFPLICMAAWVPFLTSSFWDFLRLRSPGPASPPRPPLWGEILVGVMGVLVITGNVLEYIGVKPPTALRYAQGWLRLEQRWSLFAPNPSQVEGWMVVAIETSEGEFDALTGKEIDWSRPAHLGAVLPSGPWRKFLAAVRNQRYPDRVRIFARWCARRWEAEHPGVKVQRVRVHYLWENLSKRQNPPDHWFIYEEPPGELTEQARKLGYPVPPPSDTADL